MNSPALRHWSGAQPQKEPSCCGVSDGTTASEEAATAGRQRKAVPQARAALISGSALPDPELHDASRLRGSANTPASGRSCAGLAASRPAAAGAAAELARLGILEAGAVQVISRPNFLAVESGTSVICEWFCQLRLICHVAAAVV